MFLLYLVTTSASFGIFYLSTKAYGDYLTRNGYVDADGLKSSAELKFSLLSLAFKSLIPVYNVYSAIRILWDGSKHFDEMAADDLKRGSIRKRTDEEQEALKYKGFGENKYIPGEENKKNSSPYAKSYEEMTNDEKLAYLNHERELLLRKNEEEKAKQLTK